MKLIAQLSLLALAISQASAHYIFTTVVAGGLSSNAAVRQPLNNTPVEAVSSGAMTCNNSPRGASDTIPVAAGSTVTFKLDNTMYHSGPAALYLGRVPSGQTAAGWNGGGASWFKIAEWGAQFNPFKFLPEGQSQLSSTIPSSTPAGEYLLRAEHIGLHVAGKPQYYISCAQIRITGGGGGSPNMVSIPGYVSAGDPGLSVNIYNPVPTSYTRTRGSHEEAVCDINYRHTPSLRLLCPFNRIFTADPSLRPLEAFTRMLLERLGRKFKGFARPKRLDSKAQPSTEDDFATALAFSGDDKNQGGSRSEGRSSCPPSSIPHCGGDLEGGEQRTPSNTTVVEIFNPPSPKVSDRIRESVYSAPSVASSRTCPLEIDEIRRANGEIPDPPAPSGSRIHSSHIANPFVASTSPDPRDQDEPLQPLTSRLSSQSRGGINYYPNANNIDIQQQNINNIQNMTLSKPLFEYLEPYISPGAAHNSDERCDAPNCEPETRVVVQEDIFSWIRDGGGLVDDDPQPQKVMWLSGPAGSGKTAIAGSIAEKCNDSGLLAASFFFSSFSGSADRRSKRCLVATLASHLAEHDSLGEYKAQLLMSIERQPGVFRRRLKEQAEVLILKPLRAIQHKRNGESTWPQGIVIDGLDEVKAERFSTIGSTSEKIKRTDEEDQVEVLEVLFTLAMDPAFPFRILIASRPDRAINEFFAAHTLGCAAKLFLDSKYDPDSDIERFLHSKFAAIRRRSGMSDNSWPGQEVVDRIVDMSSGQFIVPVTIVRHIMTGVPQRKLHEILKLDWVSAGTRNPFAALDALYTHILKQSPEPRLTVNWISCIQQFSDKEPQPALFWRQFLETVDGELSYVMGSTTSLIFIPPIGDHVSPFHIYHKSLLDYLSQEARCGDLFVDEAAMNHFRAERCISVLREKGPVAVIHPAEDALEFLAYFLGLTPLVHPDHVATFTSLLSPITKHRVPFLSFLDEPLKNQLASCDVAWWTRLLLNESLDFAGSALGTRGPINNKWILRAIYCNIHAQLCTSERSTECHAACTRWRHGILAESKALGYCVHELEQVDVDNLPEITLAECDIKVKWARQRQPDGGFFNTCPICRPHSPDA